MAKYVPIGEPAHDAERAALRFLAENLPSDYTIYANAWLVERTGGVYELDAVITAPHAVFVVEIKSFRGNISGTDHDWYIPHPIPSPIKLNRKTAQVLKSLLKRESYAAGQVWVQGFVFLSTTTSLNVQGPASRDRIFTKKNILAALQDPKLIERISGRSSRVSSETDQCLHRLMTGIPPNFRPPPHKIREYDLVQTLDHQDSFTEILARNSLSGAERVLRVYTIPPLASEERQKRAQDRARWEAQVLGRLGRSPGILAADPPFTDEMGIVLPLEHFPGITLGTWLERYGPNAGKKNAGLMAQTDLWIKIAEVIDEAHQQGVVHRLLRPEVVLVEDKKEPEQIRITGFDLAKQLTVDSTLALSLTSISDDRLTFAAPEVVTAFSSAEPASDQFSLGALLALLLAGQPLFENTRALMAARRLMRRVRDVRQRIPLSLDEAICKMLGLRATDRYKSIAEAVRTVKLTRNPAGLKPAQVLNTTEKIDVDDLRAGLRIGTDYEVLSKLGQGGLSVVYAARHLVSGRTRALKIARPDDAAEEALRGEYEALSKLDDANIVKVIDLTKMVEGRLTLVMERVGGETLKQWLERTESPDHATQRSLAENLLAGLDYLEQQGVTHKDLKPDNLLVADGHLTIIDFSLASVPEEAPYGGTALYRDPASGRWTHGTDRYAAALCMFELYAGRHAFDGKVPEPGEEPDVAEADISPAGLAAFFRKALHPSPEQRFSSAREMRDALLVSLGVRSEAEETSQPESAEASTSLRTTSLSKRAINALARCHVGTAGELMRLTPTQVRAIHSIGTKTATEIIALQEALRAQGVHPSAGAEADQTPLVRELVGSPEPVEQLALSGALRTALRDGGLPTIGAVAMLSRTQLLERPGIGRQRLAQVAEALFKFRDNLGEDAPAHTLDRIWELASGPLTPAQREAVERCIGLVQEPLTQAEIAADLGTSQPKVSLDLSAGLERLDVGALDDALVGLESALDGFGGIVRQDEMGHRLEEEWPAGLISGVGFVRLLVRLSGGRVHPVEVEGSNIELIARPKFDRETLRTFADEVMRVAGRWPPIEPESARRTLAALLPHYDGDALTLGYRICDDVELTETGHLFIGPIDAVDSIGFVLQRTRDPLPLDELERRVRTMFGEQTPYPDADSLLGLLRTLECQVQGDAVIPGRTSSIIAPPALKDDEFPTAVGADRRPEEVVRDLLLDTSTARRFRMLITPPEKHAEIGRSVAKTMGATWVSFEEAFFKDHAGDVRALERAEQFVAQREALTEAAEETLLRLVDEHGQSGSVTVLGDTALFALCEALDFPRRLYDETLAGGRGSWVLVVPGVIHNRQPRFNEGEPIWHLEGATLPLLHLLPPAVQTSVS